VLRSSLPKARACRPCRRGRSTSSMRKMKSKGGPAREMNWAVAS
jgi:hypothetical protein